ncbi:MAG: hypothetical protein HYU64_11115 [Armatimonadetes bacterium]|nr:hypothetical protein [Armatimonadota bacterium]
MSTNINAGMHNLNKAAASGIAQSNTNVIKKKDETEVNRPVIDKKQLGQTLTTQETATQPPPPTLGKDDIALQQEAQDVLDRQKEGVQQQQYGERQQPQEAERPSFFQSIKNMMRGLWTAEAQVTQKPTTEMQTQQTAPQSQTAQTGKPQLSPQQLLQAWLQLEPTTVQGLEKFLEVEFHHHPDNYQLFMSRQMIQMIKQAKRMIEEEKLARAATLSSKGGDDTESMNNAMLGVSMLGYAYWMRRKSRRGRVGEAEGFAAREGKTDEARGAKGKGGGLAFKNLDQAQQHLKQAERELIQAMNYGTGDEEDIKDLLHKILNISLQIAEMKGEEEVKMAV